MDSTQDKTWRSICQRLERNIFLIQKRERKQQDVKEQSNGLETKVAKRNRLRLENKETCGQCGFTEFVIPVQIQNPPGSVIASNVRRLTHMCCCANSNSEHFMQWHHPNFGCSQFERQEVVKKLKLVGR